MRAGQPETPTIPRFLAENVPPSEAVAIDPFVHSLFSANALKKELETSGRRVVPLIVNPIDAIWGPDRPPLPSAPIRIHDLQYAGLSVSDKLCSLRQEMTDKDCSHMLLSMLDEVCWTFNIRGSDVPHCPVVLSYAIIDSQGASLYVDAEKVPPIVHTALKEAGISIKPYDSVVSDLSEIAANGDKIWLDPSSTSLALADAAGKTALHETTPVQMAKARKNDAELQGMRAAHIRDGVALSMFLCWLEDYVASGEHVISEAQAANKLEEFRASQRGFLETSFGTIAGSGSNGAIIHYSPQPDACRDVNNKDVFLLDSGGQYVDGTTDVTRTMHFGNTATEHEKECFTRVLKGHIAIDTAVFPEGTTGLMLDCLARIPLWSTGLDYAHGTGHGVGACLNVHEGPHSISPRVGSNKAGLKAGMVVSNEPGYYEDGSFGIRIENLLIVVNKNTAHEFNSKKFLGFERLTFVPIDRNMIARHLLSTSEIEWLDKYHEQVWEKLSPGMEKGSYTDWLWKQTRPLVEEKAESPENADEVMTAPL